MPERPDAGPEPTRAPRRWAAAIVGSLLVAGGFAWLLRAGTLPVLPAAEHLARVRWWVPPAYAALLVVVLLVRAVRWYWLLLPLQPVPARRVMGVSFIGYAAILLLPLRTGELVRPVLIRQRGLSGWAAAGSVGAERVIDGLSLSALLFLSLQLARPLDPLPDRIGELAVPAALIPGAAYSALLLFCGAFVAMGAFYWRREWARRATERVLGLASPRLARFVADKVEHMAEGLRFLPRARAAGPFVAATVIHWILNGAGIWLMCWGAGLSSVTFWQACAVMGVFGLGTLTPNAPGFFGAFQLSMYAGLAMYVPPADVIGPGAAAVFWLFVLQTSITLAMGAAGLLMERISPKQALSAAGGDAGGGDLPEGDASTLASRPLR